VISIPLVKPSWTIETDGRGGDLAAGDEGRPELKKKNVLESSRKKIELFEIRNAKASLVTC